MSNIDFTNLPRWIYSSIRKYVKNNTGGIITHYEGEEIISLDRPRVEFRLDGPRFSIRQGETQAWVAINFVITTEIGSNAFLNQTNAGILVQALNGSSIPIYRNGNGLDDDGSYVGCFTILQDKFNFIRVYPLGNPDPALKLVQTIVEARYTMDLEGD